MIGVTGNLSDVIRFFAIRYPHRLIHFFFDKFTRRWLDLGKVDSPFGLGCTLALHSVSLWIDFLFIVSRESFPHILVAMSLLVDQVIGCRDMVVTVSLHTSDRILFFELVVFNQLLKQSFFPWHFLETWE